MPGKTAPENCPECGGPMWDNRESKRNPRSPDYVCKRKNQGCEGIVWPPREGERPRTSPRDGEKQQDEYRGHPRQMGGQELPPIHVKPAPTVSVIDLKKVYLDCLDFVLTQVVPRIEASRDTEDNMGTAGGSGVIRPDDAPVVGAESILAATHTLFIARKP